MGKDCSDSVYLVYPRNKASDEQICDNDGDWCNSKLTVIYKVLWYALPHLFPSTPSDESRAVIANRGQTFIKLTQLLWKIKASKYNVFLQCNYKEDAQF
jgi:hypothetical protein